MRRDKHGDQSNQSGSSRSGSSRSSEFGSDSQGGRSISSLDRDNEIGSDVGGDLGGEIGSERGGSSDRTSDLERLQREGNLGNERNRNEPDSERSGR